MQIPVSQTLPACLFSARGKIKKQSRATRRKAVPRKKAVPMASLESQPLPTPSRGAFTAFHKWFMLVTTLMGGLGLVSMMPQHGSGMARRAAGSVAEAALVDVETSVSQAKPQPSDTLPFDIRGERVVTRMMDLSEVDRDMWVSRGVAIDLQRQLSHQKSGHAQLTQRMKSLEASRAALLKENALLNNRGELSPAEDDQLKGLWKSRYMGKDLAGEVLLMEGHGCYYANLEICKAKMDALVALDKRMSQKTRQTDLSSLERQRYVVGMLREHPNQQRAYYPEDSPEALLTRFYTEWLTLLADPDCLSPAPKLTRKELAERKNPKVPSTRLDAGLAAIAEPLQAQLVTQKTKVRQAINTAAEAFRKFAREDRSWLTDKASEHRRSKLLWTLQDAYGILYRVETAQQMIERMGDFVQKLPTTPQYDSQLTALKKQLAESEEDDACYHDQFYLYSTVLQEAPLHPNEINRIQKRLRKNVELQLAQIQNNLAECRAQLPENDPARTQLDRKEVLQKWPAQLSILTGTEQDEYGWGGVDVDLFCTLGKGAESLSQAMEKTTQMGFVRHAPQDVNFLDCQYAKGTYVQVPNVSMGNVTCWNKEEQRPRKLIVIVGAPKKSDGDRFGVEAKSLVDFFVREYGLDPDKDIQLLPQPRPGQLHDAFTLVAEAGKEAEYAIAVIGHGKGETPQDFEVSPQKQPKQGGQHGYVQLGDLNYFAEPTCKADLRILSHLHSGALLVFSCESGAWLAQDNLTGRPQGNPVAWTPPAATPFYQTGFHLKRI